MKTHFLKTFYQDLLHPEVLAALRWLVKSYWFWLFAGLGFGWNYCHLHTQKFDVGVVLTAPFIAGWFFTTVLAAIALIDLKKMLVPDILVYPLFIVGGLTAAHTTFALWGALILGGGFWLVRFFASKALKQEAMGLGDVKLAFALGVWVTPLGVVPLLLVATISSLLGLLVRHVIGQGGGQTPFAPHLAIGGWAAYAYGGILLTYLLHARGALVGLY